MKLRGHLSPCKINTNNIWCFYTNSILSIVDWEHLDDAFPMNFRRKFVLWDEFEIIGHWCFIDCRFKGLSTFTTEEAVCNSFIANLSNLTSGIEKINLHNPSILQHLTQRVHYDVVYAEKVIAAVTVLCISSNIIFDWIIFVSRIASTSFSDVIKR